jgi:hypothetical protein
MTIFLNFRNNFIQFESIVKVDTPEISSQTHIVFMESIGLQLWPGVRSFRSV